MSVTGDWDRTITRRSLLRSGGSLAAGVALAGAVVPRAFAAPPGGYPFTLGVASGDPWPDGVVLWTRLAPDPLAVGGGLPPERYGVRYEVALDEGFSRIVRRGAVTAVPEEAHSARVELTGLQPAYEYFYRFKFGAEVSPTGRTRTAPARDARIETLRLAFVSCQNYPDGFFTPYGDAVASDLDAVVHLGDYIYEGPGGTTTPRSHAPRREIRSLDEYRIRHGQYKTDLDLQAAHASLPWLVTWDDHELENNYADEEADPNVPPEEFRVRRAAAYQAYWEHMPLSRTRKPRGPDFDLYRRFHWGDIATFNVLDTRQYRSDQPRSCSAAQRDAGGGFCPDALDPARTMLGADQKQWLFDELATTRARWNILANQTAFAPFDRNTDPNRRDFGAGDNWDGYVAERQALLDWIVERGTRNPVVITGDSHQNWVRNVPPNSSDFDAPPVATEFMGTSVSTGGDPAAPFVRFADDPDNPHIVFRNNNRGYVRCTLSPGAWTSEYRIVPTVRQRPAPASTVATLAVEDGRAGAQRVEV
jgi:alkaline phosphatase D